MHFLRTTTIAIALAFLLGCGGGGTPVMDTGPGDSGADADKRDLVKPEDSTGPHDGERPDGEDDTPEDEESSEIEPGKPGAPCYNNSECDSNLCVEGSEGGVCTQYCQSEGCPEHWYCRGMSIGQDVVFICIPEGANLCKPCSVDTQCGDGVCLETAEGKFCTRNCEKYGCSKGYECKEITHGGRQSKECLPVSGSCTCSEKNAEEERPCEQRNDVGVCQGFETCDPRLGWVGCTALEPSVEICDGIDNDCNGVADDNPRMPSEECYNETPGVEGCCKGTWSCGGEDGWLCIGPTPAAEECNYKDDNCDGQIDEGFRDTSGRYFTLEHCGQCNNSCIGRIPYAEIIVCEVPDDPDEAPTCQVDKCQDGWVLFNNSCVPPLSNLCLPCNTDSDCGYGNDKCVELDGEGYCGRDCAPGAPQGTDCPDGFTCTAMTGGGAQCIPTSGTCQCTLSNNGVKRPCEKSNEFGTCIGAEICDGLVGWGPCSAATPEREVCDGIDNDCNGIIDDNPVLPNEPCAKSWTDPVTSIEYTCTANWHCVSVGGGVNDWVCDAPSPEPEVCNGLDDNCDGQVDEDFKVNGKYGTLEHCGACGVSCIGLVEGATEMRCNTDLPKPACEVVSCEPGFWKASSLSCQPFPDTLCQRCSSDRACQVPGDKCEPADSAGRTYCLWSCDPETTIHPELTPGNYCPDGYTCVEHMAALIPGFYCVPDSGSCDCLAPDAGAERLCYNQNAYGRCQGVETCDPEHGWIGCDALVPAQETCNDIDDNCNGYVDELWPTKGAVCSEGIGACRAEGQLECNADGTDLECSATPSAGDPEICDGLDNDCDGLVDELWPLKGSACAIGQGLCYATGIWVCSDDKSDIVCNAPVLTGSPELCDGLDNNCNGQIDEIFPNLGKFCSVGTGECLSQGVYECKADGSGTECSAAIIEPDEEICDGADNDCDGQIDEDWPTLGRLCSVGIGECMAVGVQVCSNDGYSTVCDAIPGEEEDEICDGLDNDCNGHVDDPWPNKGKACSIGLGECHSTGVWECKADGSDVACNAPTIPPGTEICDGKDNNCNGEVDENFPTLGQICFVGKGECMRIGTNICSSNGLGVECSATAGPVADEICDGLDNNCDGFTDELWPTKGQPCTDGAGPCLVTGVLQCNAAKNGLECSVVAGNGTDEVCDGIDNDCNGVIDDGFPDLGKPCSKGKGECFATGVYVCTADGTGTECNAEEIEPKQEMCDGKDNNCDGVIDDGFPDLGKPCSKGMGECFRTGVYVCNADGTGTVCNAEEVLPGVEECDGKDNDCNGVIDDIAPENVPPCENQKGVCAGARKTCGGTAGWLECTTATYVAHSPNYEQTEHSCDGLDNDCDGVTDDVPAPLCEKQQGVCAGSTKVCGGANGWLPCDASNYGEHYQATETLCDGLDNDCDGSIDEGHSNKGKACSKGQGECFATGVYVCKANGTGTECNAQEIAPLPEECDGKDNDCNGVIDDVAPENVPPCENQKGVCAGARKTCGGALGWQACTTATYVAHSSKYEQTEHSCDGLDNDCDGVTDDVTAPLCENQQGVCAGSTKVCGGANGWLPCDASNYGAHYQATETKCDGLDNDCDGSIDEGHSNKGKPCSKGQGECFRTGVYICKTDGTGTECNAEEVLPGVEICDGKDNDCNGVIDNGFPTLGQVCYAGVGECQRAGTHVCNADGNGTVCNAIAGPVGNELCDGLDNNCDGYTDEDWPDKGKVCLVGQGQCQASGTYRCKTDGSGLECDAVAGSPTAEVCDYLDNDCNGVVDNGFKDADGRYTADTACANCFTDCTTIWVSSVHHASGVCNATPTIPTCTFVCDEGWVDADQNPDNGCEMQIDVGAVYVSTPYNGGTDNASCGAWNAPCATITYGIGRANGLSRPRVLVSEGIYAENITLVNGISVKGGYSATWRYSPETNVTVLYGTTPSPASVKHKRAVIAQNITSATEFSGFTIYGETNFYQATGDTGGNSYAIWVKNCSSALVIKDNVIYGGQASSGANGAAGAQGANGGDGGVGANAFDTSNRNCPGASSGAGGAGGASTCGVAGGKGADTACPYNNSQRASGANGLGTGAGTGGAGGYDRYTTDCNTGQTGGHSAEAIPGTNGANGANGARGNSCTSAAGSISGDHWVGNVATAGTAGTSGAGGGGGGAGGGLDVQTTGCSGGDTLGSAGGGGGAGGCAGQAGAIGQPGGASIGIFIVGSNGGTVPVISNNFISRNAGGNGGSGGNGGMGGIGGQGGNSGTIHVSPPLKYVYAIGSGGFGGNGGWAGAGGAGGGGCGGNSYGILSADGSAAVPNYCNPAAANTFSSVGGAGNGGAAGTSQGHAQGPAAVNGEANNCKILP